MQSVFCKRTPMLVKIAIFVGYLKQFRPFKEKNKSKNLLYLFTQTFFKYLEPLRF